MTKEILLYSEIYDFVAADLITAMEDCNDMEMCMRVNSPGGSVLAGWGIIAKMQERTKITTIKVDGAAMSMAANICLYADKVECLDVTKFMFHKAAMDNPNDAQQSFLDGVNADLRKKMEARIDSKLLKELKGYSIKDLYESENRIDLFLTASEAKKIGLVSKINTMTPKEMMALNETMFAIAAKGVEKEVTKNQPINKKPMTKEEIKAAHPVAFAAIVADAIAQEKDRVEACLVYLEIAPAEVKAAIESGKNLSAKQMAEFSLKAVAINALAAVTIDATIAPVVTKEVVAVEKTEKENEISAFEASASAMLGLAK